MENVVEAGLLDVCNDSNSIGLFDSSDSGLGTRCGGDEAYVAQCHKSNRCSSTIVEVNSITCEDNILNSKVQQTEKEKDVSCEALQSSNQDHVHETSKKSSRNSQDPMRSGEGEEPEPENLEKEVEEDDLTSKLLLSIQVLPRIPKRKQQVEDINGLSSSEKESYRSVLERVETATNRGLGSFHKWSTSGWKRSNEDNVSEDRNARGQKNDKIAKGKWSNRSKVEHRSNANDGSRSRDCIKVLKGTEVSASLSSFSTSQVECLDDSNKLITEQQLISKPGPLPTLPFEEQMRERAKLRSSQRTSQLETLELESSNKNMLRTEICGSIEKQTTSTVITGTVNTALDSQRQGNHYVVKHSPKSSSVECSDSVNSSKNITEKHSSSLKKYSANSTAEPKSRVPPRNASDHHRKRSVKNDNIADNKKSSDYHVQSTSKAKLSPPLPHLPVLPLFASVCSSDNAATQSDEKVPPTSKTVTFSCPEGIGKLSRRKSKVKKEHEKKHFKQDKLNLQQQVIKEMKNYLRPYYVRKQISKEEYKDIMRRAVPRVCHDRQHEGTISSSRIHKYASGYVDKVLKQQKRSTGLIKSDIPPPPSVQP